MWKCFVAIDMPKSMNGLNSCISMKNLSVKTEVLLLEITKGYCNLNSIPKHNAASHGKTSYCQISWSLGAARLDVILIISLWNLTDISTFQTDLKSLNPNLAAPRLHEILRYRENRPWASHLVWKNVNDLNKIKQYLWLVLHHATELLEQLEL